MNTCEIKAKVLNAMTFKKYIKTKAEINKIVLEFAVKKDESDTSNTIKQEIKLSKRERDKIRDFFLENYKKYLATLIIKNELNFATKSTNYYLKKRGNRVIIKNNVFQLDLNNDKDDAEIFALQTKKEVNRVYFYLSAVSPYWFTEYLRERKVYLENQRDIKIYEELIKRIETDIGNGANVCIVDFVFLIRFLFFEISFDEKMALSLQLKCEVSVLKDYYVHSAVMKRTNETSSYLSYFIKKKPFSYPVQYFFEMLSRKSKGENSKSISKDKAFLNYYSLFGEEFFLFLIKNGAILELLKTIILEHFYSDSWLGNIRGEEVSLHGQHCIDLKEGKVIQGKVSVSRYSPFSYLTSHLPSGVYDYLLTKYIEAEIVPQIQKAQTDYLKTETVYMYENEASSIIMGAKSRERLGGRDRIICINTKWTHTLIVEELLAMLKVFKMSEKEIRFVHNICEAIDSTRAPYYLGQRRL